MGYISKYDLRLVTYMTRKYRSEYHVRFVNVENYLLWLYETKAKKDEKEYYYLLEKDIREYADFQMKEGNYRGKNSKKEKDNT